MTVLEQDLSLEPESRETVEIVEKILEQDREQKEHNEAWKVLIVDDDRDVHEITILTLRKLEFEHRKLEFISAYSAEEAKRIIKEHPDVAVAFLDVVMEEDLAGLKLVKYIREELGNDSIRLILRTGHPGSAPEEMVVLNYDINEYRGKTDLTAMQLRTIMVTALRTYKALITIKNLNKEVDETQRELIHTLGEIAEFRSAETGRHVKRVGEISALLARKLGMREEQALQLKLAAPLHDLGKIVIDDQILGKPGKLTQDEFEIMKTHTLLGYDILKSSRRELLQLAATIAKEHHENFDGTGYPEGLSRYETRMESRIVAIVDVFDALGSKRVYKAAWGKNEIIEFLRSERGRKFAPELVDVFIENLDEIYKIREQYEDQ